MGREKKVDESTCQSQTLKQHSDFMGDLPSCLARQQPHDLRHPIHQKLPPKEALRRALHQQQVSKLALQSQQSNHHHHQVSENISSKSTTP